MYVLFGLYQLANKMMMMMMMRMRMQGADGTLGGVCGRAADCGEDEVEQDAWRYRPVAGVSRLQPP